MRWVHEGPLSQEGGHQGHTAWQRQKECVDQAEKGYQGAGGRRQAATPSTITNPYRGRACNEAICKTRGKCIYQFISSAREDTCTYIRMYHMALRCPPDAFSKEYIDVAMYSRNS
jgi:hypothetical protein